MDHGFGPVWFGFVVAGQASVVHAPPQRAFDGPAAGQNGKSLGGGIAADDVHVDAEGGGVFHEVLAVAAVSPGFADGGMLGGDPFDEGPAGGRVLHAGRGDQHPEEEPDGVDDDAPLAAHDLLACVDALAGGRHVGGGLDALGVDDARGWFVVSAFLPADLAAKEAVELVEYALFLSAGEVGVDGVPVRVVVREVAPGDPGPVHVEDRVQKAAQVVVRWPADVQTSTAALGPPGGSGPARPTPNGHRTDHWDSDDAQSWFWSTGRLWIRPRRMHQARGANGARRRILG